MPLLYAGLLLHLLAFGTLVAPVFSLQFNSATVQQCAPTLLSFSGLTSTAYRAPASLTLLPFNSTAITVPLQNINFSAGIGLDFLPFAAGSQFIASLDDASGSNIINTSDIIPVLPSPNNNSTCVQTPDGTLARTFTLASAVVSQCQNFTINYDTTIVSQAPSVRLYSPSGPSFFLNSTSDDPISGMATYIMAFPYGREIVLLMDDGEGTEETSALMTVEGDSSSPNACLLADPSTGTLSSNISSGASFSLTSRVIAITGAAVGGIAAMLGIIMMAFILRDYRRQRAQHIHFNKTVHLEKDPDSEKGIIPQVAVLDELSAGLKVKNPINTPESLLSPDKAVYERNSLASWSQAIPEDQRHPASSETKQSTSPANRLSLIDEVLNMVTPPNRNAINRKSDPIVFGSPAVPQPALFRSLSGRHLRAPSDVPADLNSRTWSAYSTVSTDSFRGYPSVTVTEPSSLPAPADSFRGYPSVAVTEPSSLPAPNDFFRGYPSVAVTEPSSLPAPNDSFRCYPSVTVTEPSSLPAPTTTPPLNRGRSINRGFVGLPTSPRDGLKKSLSLKRSNTNTRTEWYGGIAR